MVNIESVINEYKHTLNEIEILEAQKELIRDEILSLCENKEFRGFGLRVDKVTPSPVVDWAKAKEVLGLKDCILEPFKKERASYFRLKVERGIIL